MTCPKKVLLVDDDPRDQELMMIALSECGLGSEVLAVGDGVEALDYLHRRGKYADVVPGNPAVVLLDMKMPKIDGIEVLREIRRTPELQLLPVVMLSSSARAVDIAKSYNLGANAYVVKPVDFHDFAEAVKKTVIFWVLFNEPSPGTVPK